MGRDDCFPNGQKEHLTYYKGLFIYAVAGGVLIFLTSIGMVQKLLFWTPSVFVSTILMSALMVFYFRGTMKRAELVSREKDALDIIRKNLSEQERLCVKTQKTAHKKLIFATDAFLEDCFAEKLSETLVAEYFRNTGKRIASVRETLRDSEKKRPELVNTDDLKFCFHVGTGRIVKPIQRAKTRLTSAGFFGTITGFVLMMIDLKFFGSASETKMSLSELAGGLGVAGITSMLGLAGWWILSSIYEQLDDIRDRLLAELTRLTSVYGLDLIDNDEASGTAEKRDGPDDG